VESSSARRSNAFSMIRCNSFIALLPRVRALSRMA
jgi:hypothetical protein